MDETPTTEEPTNDANATPAKPEQRGGIGLPAKVSELRWKLGHQAQQAPKFRFYALYDRIHRLDVLTAAGHLVWKNHAAPGVDGRSCQDLIDSPGAGPFLRELAEELRTKRYRPPPVRRVYILGFTFRYDRDRGGRDHRYLNVLPSKKSLSRLRRRVREMTGSNLGCRPVNEVIGRLHRMLAGWKNSRCSPQ